jgi:hypothetical protein
MKLTIYMKVEGKKDEELKDNIKEELDDEQGESEASAEDDLFVELTARPGHDGIRRPGHFPFPRSVLTRPALIRTAGCHGRR